MNLPCTSASKFAASVSLLGLMAGSAFAATIPFTNDFSSSGFANGNFAAPSGGAITFSTTGTSAVAQYGSEQFTNILGASFTVETVARVSTFGTNDGGDTTVGFVLFASNGGTPATSGTNFLLADWTYMTNNTANDGRLRFLSFTGASSTAVGSNAVADAASGNVNQAALVATDYTLRVTITNAGVNTYDLSFGVFQGSSQIGSSASYSGFVSTNEFFGVRARNARSAASSGTQSIVLDSFSVAAVPEPSSFAAVAGLGALGMVATRRRRRAGR